MNISFRILLLPVVAAAFLSGCRLSPQGCDSVRVFRDSTGARFEKERIEVQWVMFRGALDSMLATRNGADLWERAARSAEEDEGRYEDSLKMDGTSLRLGDGCVDWKATWVEGGFDRGAMATAMARALGKDSTISVIKISPDTSMAPKYMDLDILGPDNSSKAMRIVFDSLQVRLEP